MGRLTGISHFLDISALQEEKSDTSDLRKAKKELEEAKARKLAMDKVKKEVEEANEREKAKEIEEAMLVEKGEEVGLTTTEKAKEIEELTTVEKPIIADNAMAVEQSVEVDGEITRDPHKLCQILIARRMQVQFEGRLLRRTIDSLDNDGRPLLNLPGCKKIYCPLRLTKREFEIITVLVESVKDRYISVIHSSICFKLMTR